MSKSTTREKRLEWAFGEIYARTALEPQDRQLVTLGALRVSVRTPVGAGAPR